MISEDLQFVKPCEVRVRIAPSPTGFLHIGLARTALFNFLFAKQHQGRFILRIEDTDIERSRKEYERDILDNLKWLGVIYDEGPDAGGNFGPYRQSEKLNTYSKYLEKLLNEDKAYYCFCSEEELETQRQYQLSIGETLRYSGECAQLSKEEAKQRLAQGKPSVIRFRVPAKKVQFKDLIRGDLEFDAALMGDMVIAKGGSRANASLPPKDTNTPLYNFAVVIDDFEMKISHIIRGEEHISNTPKQILIQEALGFSRPLYAHLPLILGPDRTKLSKRHSSASVLDYKKAGYLPEALINFMAFLGWNPGDEREIYSLPSLVKEFSLEKVQKGGAIFNIKRLDFLNGFYIRQRSIEKLTELCLPYLIEAGFIEEIKEVLGREHLVRETKEKISLEFLQKIVSIYQERLKKLSEISELTDFFFRDKLEYSKDLLKWAEMSNKEIKVSLDRLEKILSKMKTEDWTKESLETNLMPEAEKKNRGYLLWPFRVALTGKEASAGPFEIAEILGKEKTLKRIKEARGLLKN